MYNNNPSREPLEVLKTYPAFQVLWAKAETHQLQFRPKESERLKKQGQFDQVLDKRTESCWNSLSDAMNQGYHMNEAEEFALPLILVSSETEKG